MKLNSTFYRAGLKVHLNFEKSPQKLSGVICAMHVPFLCCTKKVSNKVSGNFCNSKSIVMLLYLVKSFYVLISYQLMTCKLYQTAQYMCKSCIESTFIHRYSYNLYCIFGEKQNNIQLRLKLRYYLMVQDEQMNQIYFGYTLYNYFLVNEYLNVKTSLNNNIILQKD